MKSRLLLCLLPLLPCTAPGGPLSFGSATLINEDWAFSLSPETRAEQPNFNDKTWRRVYLPHDWSVEGQLSPELASCTGYLPGGVGWYRKSISIPNQEDGKKVFLYFEGVYNRSEVYLNGQLLGRRPNGYVSFYYDATPYVKFDQENVIAVRVDHSRSADSRWYTGSGIYRDVHLIRANEIRFAPWGVFARSDKVSAETAQLTVSADVVNDTAQTSKVIVRHELIAPDGAVVANQDANLAIGARSSNALNVSLEVTNPKLWSVDSPHLYQLRTTLVQEGKVYDQSVTRTGFRAFNFDAVNGFSLNGVRMKMKGVCLHHDAGVLGAAVPRAVWKKRLLTLKSIGCNAIRTSHNPQSTDLYDLCDELGLLVMNEAFDEWEFPKRKWLRGWNVGTPGFEGSFDFFEEWGARDLADMVRRDRNHPSIFAWSIGNEVDYPNDPYSHPVLDGAKINQPMFGGFKRDQPDANRLGAIAKRLVAEVKKHDVSRPVTAALAGVVMSNETEYPGALDITGYNYSEDRYAIDHAKYPSRVIYGSENGHTLKSWKAVVDNDYIFGQFLWTGIDYLGEARPWPTRGFYSGLLDFGGAIKPRGRFRESLWSTVPVAYLGTEKAPADENKSIDAWPTWNYEPGVLVRVLSYTNAPSARLLLNGNIVGDVKMRDAETGVIAWDIPFAPGKLEVEGIDEKGVVLCRSALETAGKAAKLEVTSDDAWQTRAGSVVVVSLQVVDERGIPVMGSTDEVTCRIEGPGELLGLEASNNQDMSDYTDSVHRVFHGRILAYVRSTGKAGPVKILFKAEGLPEAALALSGQ